LYFDVKYIILDYHPDNVCLPVEGGLQVIRKGSRCGTHWHPRKSWVPGTGSALQPYLCVHAAHCPPWDSLFLVISSLCLLSVLMNETWPVVSLSESLMLLMVTGHSGSAAVSTAGMAVSRARYNLTFSIPSTHMALCL
jgi:hypothetical protein